VISPVWAFTIVVATTAAANSTIFFMMNVLVLRVRCVSNGAWEAKVSFRGGKLMNQIDRYQQKNVDPSIPVIRSPPQRAQLSSPWNRG
jgi:hypothetical protein